MGPVGMQELLIILAIILVLFGAKKIPELASGLGKGIKEFKKAQQEPDKGIEDPSAKKSEPPEETKTS